MVKIPNKVKTYKEGKEPGCKKVDFDELIYEPAKGEKINVVSWVRYPSYDFLFGYPDKTNPKAKKEVAFFQFRDTRTRKIKLGFYLDATELSEVINGFSLIQKAWAMRIKKSGQSIKGRKK